MENLKFGGQRRDEVPEAVVVPAALFRHDPGSWISWSITSTSPLIRAGIYPPFLVAPCCSAVLLCCPTGLNPTGSPSPSCGRRCCDPCGGADVQSQLTIQWCYIDALLVMQITVCNKLLGLVQRFLTEWKWSCIYFNILETTYIGQFAVNWSYKAGGNFCLHLHSDLDSLSWWLHYELRLVWIIH